MLWTIIIVILVLWLLGFIGDIAGNLVHILLVVALIILIYRLITGRKSQLGWMKSNFIIDIKR